MEKQQTTKIVETQQEDGVTCRLLLLLNVITHAKVFLGPRLFPTSYEHDDVEDDDDPMNNPIQQHHLCR
jgi:hypothetical protein